MLPPDAPDPVALDLLASVAELGSLGRAAIRHQVSQPAVSMRLRGLERRLGVVLLERGPAGTVLTPAGTRVVAAGARVLRELDRFGSEVTALRAERRTLLRVAASLTVSEHLLPAWMSLVQRDVPDLSLSLQVTNSARVIEAVIDGAVDIGFVEGHEREVSGLAGTVVRGDRLVVVVSTSHPWALRSEPVTGAELAATDLIVREAGSGTQEVVDDALRPWGGVRSRMELGSLSAVLAAARRGEGPAVLSALAVAEDLSAGRLAAVATVDIDLTRALRAVWRSDRALSTLAERLLQAAAS